MCGPGGMHGAERCAEMGHTRHGHAGMTYHCGPHIPRRFLFPGTLLLLAEEPTHGYSLLDKLTEMGVVEAGVDLNIIYRALRQLEDEGLAVSDVVDEGRGPARKVYQLTDMGWEALSFWSARLKSVRHLIDEFQKRYQSLERGSEEE